MIEKLKTADAKKGLCREIGTNRDKINEIIDYLNKKEEGMFRCHKFTIRYLCTICEQPIPKEEEEVFDGKPCHKRCFMAATFAPTTGSKTTLYHCKKCGIQIRKGGEKQQGCYIVCTACFREITEGASNANVKYWAKKLAEQLTNQPFLDYGMDWSLDEMGDFVRTLNKLGEKP